MLILADGEDVRDLVPDSSRIRLIHLAEARQIGEKRNYGCTRAAGSVICHWDDDDYSAPERLAHQVEQLMANPRASVTGFYTMRFTDGSSWWLYTGNRAYALGTSLCYLRSWWLDHPFPALQIGEDNQFVSTAAAAGALLAVESGELMYATVHAGNTSPRSIGNGWQRIN